MASQVLLLYHRLPYLLTCMNVTSSLGERDLPARQLPRQSAKQNKPSTQPSTTLHSPHHHLPSSISSTGTPPLPSPSTAVSLTLSLKSFTVGGDFLLRSPLSVLGVRPTLSRHCLLNFEPETRGMKSSPAQAVSMHFLTDPSASLRLPAAGTGRPKGKIRIPGSYLTRNLAWISTLTTRIRRTISYPLKFLITRLPLLAVTVLLCPSYECHHTRRQEQL